MKIVKVVVKVEGLHRWSNCDIDEVKYLKGLHRHIFHIIAKKEVSHNNREIEIIQFAHQIEQFLKVEFFSTVHQCCYFNHYSCEDIAEILFNEFDLFECEVNEDGEHGAIIVK